MSVVAVVELLAWAVSALLAGWMVRDVVRVRRRHGEAALIDAADPLDEPPAEPLDEPVDEQGTAATRSS